MMSFLPWRSPARRRAVDAGTPSDAAQVQALGALRTGPREAVDAAIAVLYAAEAPRVYRYALALAGNAAWAADATQEAFVALALRPQGYDAARGPLGAWLAGVARHALAAQWRQALGHEPWAEGDAGGDGAEADEAAAPSPETLLVRAEDGAAVWEALRQLAPAFREAVVLVDLQERSYAEAAAIAGIELNTLRTRLHRGRQRLAALLGAERGASR
jgi:RNA polymerase sigma-70 factor (ECF subfamily)